MVVKLLNLIFEGLRPKAFSPVCLPRYLRFIPPCNTVPNGGRGLDHILKRDS